MGKVDQKNQEINKITICVGKVDQKIQEINKITIYVRQVDQTNQVIQENNKITIYVREVGQKQARKARQCDSITHWNYHSLTDPLTDRGNC